ncbi:hypothetical protein CXB51_009083 [Gossypium anomalum]|uniref:DUF4283 domain-containing protein n=1 Tax=Gossypium anomalum TaxID=47600 RepID=A0A8J6D794_9ROSI|nr:hypothetical protein CXB51_009083 [Gossypium anomalum]
MEGDTMVSELDISGIQFWIQIHNLPMDLMTTKNAKIIGEKLGTVVQIDDLISRNGIGRSFLRIRMEVQICYTLVEGFWVPRPNKEKL